MTDTAAPAEERTDVLSLTLTIPAPQRYVDDCDHATLIGIVRRALEASEELAERYPRHTVELAVPITQSMNSDTYRSSFVTADPYAPSA